MMHTTPLHYLTELHTLKAIRSYSYRRLLNSLTDAECIYMSVCMCVCVCVCGGGGGGGGCCTCPVVAAGEKRARSRVCLTMWPV